MTYCETFGCFCLERKEGGKEGKKKVEGNFLFYILYFMMEWFRRET